MYHPNFKSLLEHGAKLRNFTPHPLVVVDEESKEVLNLSSEGSIRLREKIEGFPQVVDGITFVEKEYQASDDLPSPEEGVLIVVSKMVMDAISNRLDLVCPDTGPDSAVRDADGRIVAVKRLQYREIE
jgi:hypothetical protein